MIGNIEFHVSGQKETILYDRESYLTYLQRKKTEYVGLHYAIKQWFTEGKSVESEYKVGIPTFNWDGIAFLDNDRKNIIICNTDASERFKISLPENLIQWEDYYKHFNSKIYSKQSYELIFERFDDYFEYENENYIQIRVALSNINNSFDCLTQIRYINSNTGEFLPFSKKISKMTPNQYSYNEETVDL